MMRRRWSILLASGPLLLAAACNAILDNKPADPAADTSSLAPTQPPGDDGNGSPAAPEPSGSATSVPPDTTSPPLPPPASTCADGQRLCNGRCVGNDDPMTGCGNVSCAPCAVPHATATCNAGACVVGTCDPSYANCNQLPGDGCESALSHPDNCGACGAVCPPATPMCSTTGNAFTCTNGCSPLSPLLCGKQCVDPLTSAENCGGCGKKCPDVPQATTSCIAGQCTFTCQPGYHLCGGKCMPAIDPSNCGPTCAVCPMPANAVASCSNNACGFTCTAGHADCNKAPADGCEVTLATDPANCGACGTSCNGGTCVKGACQTVDAGPDH